MLAIELNVEPKQATGTTVNKQLRRSGLIPAVIYGPGEQPLTFTVNSREYSKSHGKERGNHLYKFKSDNKDLDGKLALVKDQQFEPLKGEILHIDFLMITEGKTLTVSVPVELEGEPECVKQGTATVNQIVTELEVSCKPKDIPERLSLDISALKEGDTLLASAIKLPEGITLVTSADQVIVSAAVNRRAALEEEKAAPVEVASATAAEAGAKPAEEK